MVYESDFYTTRRPYRPLPSVSSYTSTSIVPSRQVKILPGIGRVYVVNSYDRLIPYIGHKRLTVVSSPPSHFRVRPSVIVREIDRIINKARPYIYYTPSYLHSEPLTFFDTETKLLRARTNALLKAVQTPVPRVHVPWPLIRYYYDLPLPVRVTSDEFVNRLLTPITTVKDDIYRVSHYYTEPIKRYLGPSHLACVRYGGEKAYSRRRNLTVQDIYAMQSDAVRSDIHLLSYYINMNKQRKALQGSDQEKALPALRPTRVFSKPAMMEEPNITKELVELREQRAERQRKIYEIEDKPAVENTGSRIKRSTKQEEERLAEERALAEEKAKKQAAAKKEEEARRAELARQEALAKQAEAEKKAEKERKAELARQEELAKKAEEARIEAEKAEQVRIEAEKAEQARIEAEKAEQARIEAEKAEQARIEDEKRQEEERQQLLRLEELARQAEEEKERELARQAEELAELARQEAELAEQARKEAELAELAKQETELAELERQEKELAELDKKDREAAEAAKQEAELSEQKKEEEEVAALESHIPSEEESSGAVPAASEEPAASEPEVVASEPEPEDAGTDPEPVIEEPETPEAAPASTAEEVEEE